MAVTRQYTANRIGVELDVATGQYLIYEVKVEGAQALFVIGDQYGAVVLQSSQPPVASYQARWPQAAPSHRDVTHTLSLSFLAAARYHYRAALFNATGTLIITLKDCDYAGEPGDWFLEPLRVLTP